MPSNKRVIINPYVFFNGTSRKTEFSKIEIDTPREEVEATNFGNRAKAWAKGIYDNGLGVTIRPSNDGVFRWELYSEQDSEDATPFVFREKDAPVGPDNLEATCSVMVTKVPALGGQHGALVGGDVSWKVDGAVAITDGTNTITMG